MQVYLPIPRLTSSVVKAPMSPIHWWRPPLCKALKKTEQNKQANKKKLFLQRVYNVNERQKRTDG